MLNAKIIKYLSEPDIDFIIINLERTLDLVQVRHLIVGFPSDVTASDCTGAVAAKLQLNDKLYYVRTEHASTCLSADPIIFELNFFKIALKSSQNS